MKRNIYLLSGFCMILAVGMLVGCGEEKMQTIEEQTENIINENVEPVEPEEIPEDIIIKLLERDIDHEVVIKTHEVSITDETNSEGGKYDLVDKVNVEISFTDEFGVLPQIINKDVYFMRDASSGQWEAACETCKKWDVKFKKLGGTSWKMATDDGDIYFRLRDTIEFFTTQPDRKAKKVDETKFSTTILGAMYMNVDGEPTLRRIHVMSGTLSENGDIDFHIEYSPTTESIEINLNSCEKIERDELPFDEEKFRETSDQR